MMSHFVSLFALLAFLAHGRSIPGVQTPLSITPTVDISDAEWLLAAYSTVLARPADDPGFRVNFHDMQNGFSRLQMYNALISSAEWAANPQLANKSAFVQRGYLTILKRAAQSAEVGYWTSELTTPQGAAPGAVTWPQFLHDLFYSQEYRDNCPTEYYTLGSQVNANATLLEDLFNGVARMQLSTEATYISLTIPTAVRLWDQKLPTWYNPKYNEDGPGTKFIAFTPAFLGGNSFTITVLQSSDAIHFTEIGPIWTNLPNSGVAYTVYDGHVSVDYSVCPPRYVMAMECAGNAGTASLCTSFSTYPSKPFTWTFPMVIVDGCAGGNPRACNTIAAESASTGVTLHDGYEKYAAWTQVYDGVGPSDPQVHTYSQSTGPLESLFSYFGNVMRGTAPINTMMSTEPHPWCTDAWDCNNRDKQDWKKEGSYFYALYNGANYYRCNGEWGISVARSTTAVGPEYTDRLPISLGIPAVVNNTCGISYPVLNVIEGELYVYYAWVNVTGDRIPMRSKLVPL
jgi:hypothetical protein